MNNVARPRKEIKPIQSVNVVRMTADATAGSILSHFRVRGMIIPKKLAISRFRIMARHRTIPSI